VDESSFDNLVRKVAGSVQSRRAIAAAMAGLGLSMLSVFAEDAEATRRRALRRKRRKVRRDDRKSRREDRRSRKGSGGGLNNPLGGRNDDLETPESCPIDPKTGKPGFICPDGQCSCGGTCCEKGFACFAGTDPADEVCCFDDPSATELPGDVEFAVCPGAPEPRDTCCTASECQKGDCVTFRPGRYRRNPR
jgi:hypothetical protein